MNNDAILLLGGNGFIGRALTHKFATEGYSVYVLSPNAKASLPNVQAIRGSLGDCELLAKVLPHCQTVIHLASATTPGSSASRPILELDNLAPTLSFLETLQAYPERHLIFFSSGGTVYGNPRLLPVKEDAPLAPLSYYGAGKVALESMVNAYRAHGNGVTILRPSNAYGPGQTMRQGFGLIRTILEHARVGTPIEIWGDGQNVRDYIYIDDIVEACSRLTKLPLDSGTYNLGSGTGYNINQLIEVVGEVCGKKLPIIHKPARTADVRSIVLDTNLLSDRLKWQANVSLDDGIKRTWTWLKET